MVKAKYIVKPYQQVYICDACNISVEIMTHKQWEEYLDNLEKEYNEEKVK